MRIVVITDTSEQLISAINNRIIYHLLPGWKRVINEDNSTWYAHTPAPWDETAMLSPSVQQDKVVFTVCWCYLNDEPTPTEKSYILSRFTKMLFVHFTQFYRKLETYR